MTTTAAQASTKSWEMSPRAWTQWGVMCALLAAIYWEPIHLAYINWNLTDSYYSHGFLIAPIVAVLIWRQRAALRSATPGSCSLGYLFLVGGIVCLFLGDFLGFVVFSQFSMLPVLFGLSLVLLGVEMTRLLAFPIGYLIFMVPIPASVTQSIALNLKLFAAERAVDLARLVTLPMVREGSFIYFKDDYLLVGDVCGGLRSLIALLAMGVLMAYLSKSRLWAQLATVLLSGPIAIIANVIRIFLLCVIGYFWGSDVASGLVHDISGFLVFIIAFMLFFMLEALLRRLAPAKATEGDS